MVLEFFGMIKKKAFFEVFSPQQKHICPNRANKPTNNNTTAATRQTYYKKSWSNTPKPKMSNSLELLSGSIDTIKKHYEILLDLISDLGGKCHGHNQQLKTVNNISLVVYYELPLGMRDEIKQKFQNNTKPILQQQQQYRR